MGQNATRVEEECNEEGVVQRNLICHACAVGLSGEAGPIFSHAIANLERLPLFFSLEIHCFLRSLNSEIFVLIAGLKIGLASPLVGIV